MEGGEPAEVGRAVVQVETEDADQRAHHRQDSEEPASAGRGGGREEEGREQGARGAERERGGQAELRPQEDAQQPAPASAMTRIV